MGAEIMNKGSPMGTLYLFGAAGQGWRCSMLVVGYLFLLVKPPVSTTVKQRRNGKADNLGRTLGPSTRTILKYKYVVDAYVVELLEELIGPAPPVRRHLLVL